jgi:hypothetical protein
VLTDSIGAELSVGDVIGTVTGGQNAMVITGKITTIHDVKITVEVMSAKFVGNPISAWVSKLPQVGQSKQLNAYRVFRLGPCVHDQAVDVVELRWTDLYFETWRDGSVRVKMTHKPTGLTGEGDDPESTLEAKAVALKDLTQKVAEHERKEREKGH